MKEIKYGKFEPWMPEPEPKHPDVRTDIPEPTGRDELQSALDKDENDARSYYNRGRLTIKMGIMITLSQITPKR